MHPINAPCYARDMADERPQSSSTGLPRDSPYRSLAFVTLIICLSSVAYHLPQFPLLGEFAAQYAKVANEFFAGLHQSGFRCECSVRLYAEDEFTGESHDFSVHSLLKVISGK